MDVKPVHLMVDILSYKTYKATIHFWSLTPVTAARQAISLLLPTIIKPFAIKTQSAPSPHLFAMKKLMF